jgi:hypothetical protein
MSIPAQPTFGGSTFQTVQRKKRQEQPRTKKACRTPTLKKASQQAGDERQKRKRSKANKPESFRKKTPHRVIDRWGVLTQKN